ncbi:S-adenosyl-L-methionine-dependent methyltransferase, partial [Pavlovales sp. CCMP2436]
MIARLGVAPASRTFFAVCPRGLESVLALELRGPQVRAQNVEAANAGVWFDGSGQTGMAAVLWLRSANRVMELLSSARATPTRESPTDWFTKAQLYDFVRGSVDWETLLTPEACGVQSIEACTLACDATIGQVDRSLCNSHYTALEVKNALVDEMRQRHDGLRPSVDTENPMLPLQVHVHQDSAWLFRTLSPYGSMHRRGYRQAMHVAALRENLAAGLILQTGFGFDRPENLEPGAAPGFDPDSTVLCDPMCGSATLAVEAALIATETAPGLLRWGDREAPRAACSAPPPFCNWPDYSTSEWESLLETAEYAVRPLKMRIHLNDAHPGALALAQQAFDRLGFTDAATFSNADIADFEPPERPTLIVANPPWGRRIGRGDEAWERLGRFAKSAAPAESAGIELWTLSGASDLTRHLHMKASRKVPLEHGGVDLRWIRYSV